MSQHKLLQVHSPGWLGDCFANALSVARARTAGERNAPDIKRARLRISNALQRLIDRDMPLRAHAGTHGDDYDAGYVQFGRKS